MTFIIPRQPIRETGNPKEASPDKSRLAAKRREIRCSLLRRYTGRIRQPLMVAIGTKSRRAAVDRGVSCESSAPVRYS